MNGSYVARHAGWRTTAIGAHFRRWCSVSSVWFRSATRVAARGQCHRHPDRL